MRQACMLLLLLAGCTPDWGLVPTPAAPDGAPPRLYGRPLALVRETRRVPTAGGVVSARALVLRAGAIRGVMQVEANDCGPAAIATLLGYYGLRAAGDADALLAVKRDLPPKQWGTRLEDASAYLNGTGRLWARAYRDGDLASLMARVQDGRPVPVVVTLEGNLSRMHWLLVAGLARTDAGDRYVLCKNPSDADPLAFSAYAEATFDQIWENSPLRSQWWSGLMAGVADTNAASYRRPYLDVGALMPP